MQPMMTDTTANWVMLVIFVIVGCILAGLIMQHLREALRGPWKEDRWIHYLVSGVYFAGLVSSIIIVCRCVIGL